MGLRRQICLSVRLENYELPRKPSLAHCLQIFPDLLFSDFRRFSFVFPATKPEIGGRQKDRQMMIGSWEFVNSKSNRGNKKDYFLQKDVPIYDIID